MATVQELSEIINQQKKFFAAGNTLSYTYRLNQLKKLREAVLKYEMSLTTALQKDLGKAKAESYMTEIGFVLASITYAQKHLKKWMKSKKVCTPWYLFPAKSCICRVPYGSVLIISPYNYPVQLLLEPLIGAIAAGNCTVASPSDLTPAAAGVLKQLISETFPAEYIYCTDGTVEENTALLNSDFDYIFFTGSKRTGKIIMRKAAEKLIPVTLELGGKSPVILDKTADLKVSARRIIWGKLLNAGQTCVAPDYLLVDEAVKEDLIKEMMAAIREFYGENIEANPDYGRIVNLRHFHRLKKIMEEDENYIIYGGKTNEKNLFIEPTLFLPQDFTAVSMQEEIFGPLLPVFGYDDLDKALNFVNEHDKPLALYIFSQDKKRIKYILNRTSSGGVAVNDTITHLSNPALPFGGIGASGMGKYHGRYSFETFSHERSILTKTVKINLKLMFPPFSALKYKLIHRFFR